MLPALEPGAWSLKLLVALRNRNPTRKIIKNKSKTTAEREKTDRQRKAYKMHVAKKESKQFLLTTLSRLLEKDYIMYEPERRL